MRHYLNFILLGLWLAACAPLELAAEPTPALNTPVSLTPEVASVITFWPAPGATPDRIQGFEFGVEVTYTTSVASLAHIVAIQLHPGEAVPECQARALPMDRPFWADQENFPPGQHTFQRRFPYADLPDMDRLLVRLNLMGDNDALLDCTQEVYPLTPAALPTEATPTAGSSFEPAYVAPDVFTPPPLPEGTFMPPVPSPFPFPTYTPTPDFSAVGAQARILDFSVSPAEILSPAWRQLGQGDVITLTWEVEGEHVIVPCAPDEPACPPAPLKGSKTYKFYDGPTGIADHWVDLTLSVWGAGYITTAEQTLRAYVKCHYHWFQAGLSAWCPDWDYGGFDVVGQTFEHGLMIWMPPNNVTVLLEVEGNPYRAFYALPQTAPDLASLQPPAGRYAPEARVASVWLGMFKGTEDLRAQLGWATAPAVNFTTYMQAERTPPEVTAQNYQLAPDGRVFSLQQLEFHPPDSDNGNIISSRGTYHWWSGRP